jgi:hypothetical protein
MQPDLEQEHQSFLGWIIQVLGFKYGILLTVSALVGFVLTLIVVRRGKGSMAGVALALIMPVPFLIGVYSSIEYVVSYYLFMAVQPPAPQSGHEAGVKAVMLVLPMVGMLLMAPSYILAIIGSLLRSFSADPKVSSEGHE